MAFREGGRDKQILLLVKVPSCLPHSYPQPFLNGLQLPLLPSLPPPVCAHSSALGSFYLLHPSSPKMTFAMRVPTLQVSSSARLPPPTCPSTGAPTCLIPVSS